MRTTLVALVFCFSLISKSQTVPPTSIMRDEIILDTEGDVSPSIAPTSNDEEEKIYTLVEQNAEYSGGTAALLKFISSTIVYPEYAKDNEIQGRVFIKFVVKTDGSLSDIKVARSVPGGKMLDDEAIRVIKLTSGKWKPARQNGKTVSCNMTLPVVFVLQ
jgi:protein TonB